MSPLYCAVAFHDLETIKTLGELRINPNLIQEDTGYTALHIAAIKNHIEAVYILFHYFRNLDDIDIRNSNNIKEKEKNKMKSSWLDINIQDKKGNTALHYACKLGHEQIVAMLCQEEDINLGLHNQFKQTPLDLIGNHAVYSYLMLAKEKQEITKELCQIQLDNSSSKRISQTAMSSSVSRLRNRVTSSGSGKY
jgi:ankyrin repeat protein